MLSRGRTLVAPLYLFACLVLGGSAQGIWQNMFLQLAGVAIVAWAALDKGDGPMAPAARWLLLMAMLAVAFVVLQLLPLPASVWPAFGGHGGLAEGFAAIGLQLPPQPLSVAPASSLDALLAFIPPLAIFCAMVRLKAYRPRWLVVALITATLAGVALGALQVVSSKDGVSPWYLYADTSVGRAVGFFANADHMASLLLVTIPFLFAIPAAAKSASMQRYSALIAIAAGTAIVIVIGLMLNGSLAGYGLAIPVLAASALILLPSRSRLRLWLMAAAALFVVVGVAAMETSSIGSGRLGAHATSAVQSRAEIFATTAGATADFMPFGSGLGTFQSVYPLYERPEQVTSTFVVHAHNDYAELALELGLPGMILMLLFLAWWGFAVWRAWRTAEAGPFARAAAIASAAILVHSIVDFPLRTAAIAASFGMCMALLADGRAAPPQERRELRKRRHVEFR